MKIYDYKKIKHSRTSKKFKTLDKSLLACNSLAEQIDCLVKYYNESTIARDELIVRKFNIQHRSFFGLFENIKRYMDLFIGVMVSAIAFILGKQISGEIDGLAGKNIISYFILFIGLICCFILRDKKFYYRTEVPVCEIYLLELEMITKALEFGVEDFDVSEFFDNYYPDKTQKGKLLDN